MQCTKIRSDAAEIKKDSYLEQSKIRKDNGIMINTAPNKIELPDFGKSSTVSNQFVTDPDVLVNNLSFSHIREIMGLTDAFERFFYETECMKCNWNVRELRRQIKTNLYVRAGISKKPELLLKKFEGNGNGTMLSIKDPFTFEFLGLAAKDAVSESDLEQALMDHLQEFMLELGEGFCFEARQKRIVIDDKYYFIDLVFYNIELKCYVLIDLKMGKITHQDVGQIDMYVRMYDELKCKNDEDGLEIETEIIDLGDDIFDDDEEPAAKEPEKEPEKTGEEPETIELEPSDGDDEEFFL